MHLSRLVWCGVTRVCEQQEQTCTTRLRVHASHPSQRALSRRPTHLTPPPRTWEQRQPQEKLGRDAAKAPHVDGRRVAEPQQHLGAAVEAALDVAVRGARLKAGRAKVDELQLPQAAAAGAWRREQDVFGLEVAVDDRGLAQHDERVQDLVEGAE